MFVDVDKHDLDEINKNIIISKLNRQIANLESNMTDLVREIQKLDKESDELRNNVNTSNMNESIYDPEVDDYVDPVTEIELLKHRMAESSKRNLELSDMCNSLRLELYKKDQVHKATCDIIDRINEDNAMLNDSLHETFDHITWDEYFMGVAEVVKSRSKDPNTKVGACIVKDNRIISTGYNGFPYGCDDNKYPWGKGNEDITKNKYFYVTHAELNAILNARQSVEGATVYVTLFPCNECAKAIIQSGIKKVIFKNMDTTSEEKMRKYQATVQMFADAGVDVDAYTPGNKLISIEV